MGLIFFTVCGGAYGIEPLVGKLGAGWAIVLIIVTPLLWSIPISLMVSEFSAMMPVEGGYYVWVKRGLGNFWGFQEGWWTCLYTSVDMAIYPVLFVNYLAFFVPALKADENGEFTWEVFFIRWAIAVGLIICSLALNWRGARAVGRNAAVFLLVVVLPFLIITIVAFGHPEAGFASSVEAFRSGFSMEMNGGLLAVGLATVMWNYSGWDNVSTYAGEVNDASRNYPRGLFFAMILTFLVYLLPTFALIGRTTNPEVWNETAGFPVLAEMVGGIGLGVFVAAAALVSAWSLFNSQILYASRLPFSMAVDGWLPRFFARSNAETGVPTNALVVCCVVAAAFASLPFGKLVVVDIVLYSAEVLLEFAALIALRRSMPNADRPFKIPGGIPVLILLTLLPLTFVIGVVWGTLSDPETDTRHLWIVVAGLASGVILYFVRRRNVNAEA